MLELYKNKIIESFKKCNNGSENFNIVLYYWGIGGYVITLFIIDWVVTKNQIYIIDFILSILIAAYFAWHIFAIYHCKPKKKKLSKSEKIIKKQQLRSQRFKIIMDKILLRRSISKFNAPLILTLIDIYIISNYLGKLYY